MGLLLVVSFPDVICSTGKILLFRMSILRVQLQRKPYYNFIAGKLEANLVCISITPSYHVNKSFLYRLNHGDSDEKLLIIPPPPMPDAFFSQQFKEIVN